MSDELTIAEACKNHLLAAEDYPKNCNPDGTVKSHSQQTTFSTKNHSNYSVTIDTFWLPFIGLGIVIIVTAVIVLLRKRKAKKAHI